MGGIRPDFDPWDTTLGRMMQQTPLGILRPSEKTPAELLQNPGLLSTPEYPVNPATPGAVPLPTIDVGAPRPDPLSEQLARAKYNTEIYGQPIRTPITGFEDVTGGASSTARAHPPMPLKDKLHIGSELGLRALQMGVGDGVIPGLNIAASGVLAAGEGIQALQKGTSLAPAVGDAAWGGLGALAEAPRLARLASKVAPAWDEWTGNKALRETLAEGEGLEPMGGRAALPAPIKGNQDIRNVVSGYMKDNQVAGRRLDAIKKVDPERGAEMAQVYANLKSEPHNPEVRAAYAQLSKEIDAQYKALEKAGFKFEFTSADPYKNSADMLADLKNKKIRVFSTPTDAHPVMTAEENNKFRAVHDAIGHGLGEHQFGPRGEEMAFREHSSTLSPQAARAMATETRGQNSWVNFGPNKDLPVTERPYAEQKAALWPEAHMGDYHDMPGARPMSQEGLLKRLRDANFGSERGAVGAVPTPPKPPLDQGMVNSVGIRATEKAMKAAGRTEMTAEDFAAGEAAMAKLEAAHAAPAEVPAPKKQSAGSKMWERRRERLAEYKKKLGNERGAVGKFGDIPPKISSQMMGSGADAVNAAAKEPMPWPVGGTPYEKAIYSLKAKGHLNPDGNDIAEEMVQFTPSVHKQAMADMVNAMGPSAEQLKEGKAFAKDMHYPADIKTPAQRQAFDAQWKLKKEGVTNGEISPEEAHDLMKGFPSSGTVAYDDLRNDAWNSLIAKGYKADRVKSGDLRDVVESEMEEIHMYNQQHPIATSEAAKKQFADYMGDNGLPGRSFGEVASDWRDKGMGKEADNLENFMSSPTPGGNRGPSVVTKPQLHSTGATDIDAYDRGEFGFHFGTPAAARDVARDVVQYGQKGSEYGMGDNLRPRAASTYPVWLNIKKPLRMRDLGFWDAQAVSDELRAKNIISLEEVEVLDRHMDAVYKGLDRNQTNSQRNYQSSRPVHQLLESKGYDGIVYANNAEGVKGEDSYIAWNPNQIKSTIGNRGTFNPMVHDIRGASGASILAGGAGGGAAGSAAGAQTGDTPEERRRNMMLGMGAGLVAGMVGGHAPALNEFGAAGKQPFRSAAMRGYDKKGVERIFEGSMHPEGSQAAQRTRFKIPSSGIAPDGRMVDGYMTHEGVFVARDEAPAYLKKGQRPRSENIPGLHKPNESGAVGSRDYIQPTAEAPAGIRNEREPTYRPPRADLEVIEPVLKNIKKLFSKAVREAQKTAPGKKDWYRTQSLANFGTPENIEQFLKFMGPTSISTAVERNIKGATMMHHLEGEGILTEESLRSGHISIPQGYASHRQKSINKGLLDIMTKGNLDPFNQPKTYRYTGNLMGNEGSVALDSQNGTIVGLPGQMMKQDQATGKFYLKDAVGYPTPGYRETGRVSSSPAKTHYGAIEDGFIKEANHMGLTPGSYSALGWPGQDPRPFMVQLMDLVHAKAEETGMNPEKILEMMLAKKLPL